MMPVPFVLMLAALPLLQEPTPGADKASPAKPLAGNPPIAYPAQAREVKIGGPVRFRIRVSAEGAVESVDVEQVPQAGLGFEEAIRDAVRRWRFEPARSGGMAVPSTRLTQLRFQLSPGDEKAIEDVFGEFQKSWNDDRLADIPALLESTDHFGGQENTGWMPMDKRKALDWLAARRAINAGSITLELRSIRFLWADVAQVEFQFRRSGSSPEATRKGSVTSYLVKSGSRWRILRIGSQPFEPPRLEAAEPKRAGSEIVEPRKLRHVSPVYPIGAQQSRIQGSVILECVIDPEGNVTSTDVVFGPPALIEAAQSAVRKWRYTPTLLDGRPVPVIMTVTVNFRLR